MSWTIICLVVLCVAIVAVSAHLARWIWRRHNTPRELRGDWWPRFESEFRAYVERGAKAAGESRRRTRDRKSPPR